MSMDGGDGRIKIPEELDKETAIALLKESNDHAFSQLTKEYYKLLQGKDPFLIPMILSALSHDYVY